MLYLTGGRDEFRREEFIGQLKARMQALVNGEHNIIELTPPISLADLIGHCDTTPFLCEKRMVIARGALSQPGGLARAKSARGAAGDADLEGGPARGRAGRNSAAAAQGLQELFAYLGRLPETTHLVMVEDDDALLQPLAAVP